MEGDILAYQEEQGFPEELHEGGGQEVVTSGHGVSEELESSCSEDSSHGKVFIEETGKKEYNFAVLVHGSIGVEVEEYWAEGVWTGKWYHEQRAAWMKQVREVQMWRQVRGPAGAVKCETRDLGIKWPQWHNA